MKPVVIGVATLMALAASSSAATTFGGSQFTGFASGQAERRSDMMDLVGFNNSGPFGDVLADGGGGTTSGGIGDGAETIASVNVTIDVGQIGLNGDGGFLVDIFALATFDAANYIGDVNSSINTSTTLTFSGSGPMQAFIAKTGTLGGDDVDAVTLRDQDFNALGPGAVMLIPGQTYTLQINTFVTAGGAASNGDDSIIGAFVLSIPSPGTAVAGLALLAAAGRRRR